MRKTKEYISDVQQKIIEASQISEVALRKELEQWKIPISTIQGIIKNFQSTEDVMNLPGEDMCLYRPNAREEESWVAKDFFKDHSWRTVENSWVLGSENLIKKKGQTAPTPHVVREGFKKNYPSSSKNNLQHIQLSDTTGTLNGTGFYGQMKLNNELFSSKHSRWVWWTQG